MTDAFDVVVIGAGTAGIPLAIEAAAQGLRVNVVEQASRVGGTLWRSWGQMSAGGTQLQQRRGIVDSPSRHFEDVMRISKGTANPLLVRLAVEEAPHTIDWLMSRGFDMDPACPALHYFHEPYSVARTYWGRRGGRSLLEVLEPALQAAVEAGSVRIDLGTRLVSLVRSVGPHIEAVGVQRADGSIVDIDAEAFVLTTGGYAGNPQLFSQLTGGLSVVSPAPATSDGSGMIAARAAGARIGGGDLFLPTFGGIADAEVPGRSVPLDDYPNLIPQSRPPWEIYVNARGERFVAEDCDSVDQRERALLAQPGLQFWIVFDSEVRDHAPPLLPTWSAEAVDDAFVTHPAFTVADDLDTLGDRAGIDPVGLRRTVAAYNAGVTAQDDSLGRQHLPCPLQRPPFFAIHNHGTTLKSPAGLIIDDRLRVLAGQEPFDNLYAAGEVIGGSTLSGQAFVGGMSVTPALSFGRLLGRCLSRVSVKGAT